MSDKKLTLGKTMNLLNWAYNQALSPSIPGFDSAFDLANYYSSDSQELAVQVNRLINWQTAKNSATGFVTGLGGLATMPITVPADITAVLFVQIRMVAAIAIMAGLDPHCDQVKTFCYVCLLGNSGKEGLKQFGIVFGKKMATNAIRKIPGKTLVKINQMVGMRLLTKFGEKGLINLGKAVPLVGGVIGGTADGIWTKKVGKVACRVFVENL